MKPERVVIIGAGPAGLTAAYLLMKQMIPAVVLEKDRVVGGLARTVHYHGFHFDIGGHRFFTKVAPVDALWREILGKDFLRRPRLSRIYYRRKFFHYPLKPMNALLGLGIWNALRIFGSYVKARCRPLPVEENFEQWTINRFGRRLYQTFFKSYTEKVWGIPCTAIRAEWAAQRIKGLSLRTAIWNALVHSRKKTIKTLIDEFDYPKFGPGMLWETTLALVREKNPVYLQHEVVRIAREETKIVAVETVGADGQRQTHRGSHFISSMPLRHLLENLDPLPPPAVLQAAHCLKYRDFITVALIVKRAHLFPDNWIYVHDPDVKVGRIQNFKNWSPYMVPDDQYTCLGLEYFCFEGDGLWTMTDAALVALATKELVQIGLVAAQDVIDGTVVRMPKAYPVYDEAYQQQIGSVQQFVDQLENLYAVGRNGMHKYNNQDHSMLTAMLAIENIEGAHHDLWKVNTEMEYHEEQKVV